MHSVGSAIIILGSCVCFSAAAFVTHNETNFFLNGVAAVVGTIGILGWWGSLAKPNNNP